MRNLFSEQAAPTLAEQPLKARDTACWYPGGCWNQAAGKHLCEEHKWEGEDWTRETAEGIDGEEFTYIAPKVISPPMQVSQEDLKRAALEEAGEKLER